MKSLEVSCFRGHLNRELKYVNKARRMRCPYELNLDHVTPGDPMRDADRNKGCWKGQRRHCMLNRANSKSRQNPTGNRGM